MWFVYGKCGKCYADEGEPCNKLHANPDGTMTPTGIWCVNPHPKRRLRYTHAELAAMEVARRFGTSLQSFDVDCDTSDGGCGAIAGEKCHGDDWQKQSPTHGARERRAMYVKHMWRTWN